MKPERMTDATTNHRATLMPAILIFVIALGLRAFRPDRAAVEHFDEGVYASNIFFGSEDGFAYPQRHLYAPPLVPFVIEWSITFFGNGSFGTLFPSALIGALTVVLVWHVARRWFGEEAGLPTALVAMLSDFHIAYSRTALTDVWLGLFLLLSVYLGTEASRQRNLRRAVAAGVACGIAWWCKYNGWLAIAIVATGVTVWIAVHRRAAVPSRATACVALMALIAVVTWSPVWLGLRDHGGYEAVVANHGRYVVGLAGWMDSAKQQFVNHRAMDGSLSWCSLLLATAVALVRQLKTRHFTWNQSAEDFEIGGALLVKILVGGLLLALLAACGVGTSAVLLCCALGGVAGRIRWPAIPVASTEGSDDGAIASWALPCWIVAVWLGALLLVTPLYRPYPRLTMPLLIGSWLGAGAGLSWWVRANLRWHGRKEPRRPVLRHNTSLILLTGLAALVVVRNQTYSRRSPAWEPRTGMMELAAQIRNECITSPKTVVYTYGEPALFFHLNASGVPAHPISSLPTAAPGNSSVEVLVIEGPHARRSDSFSQEWSAVMRQYEKVRSFDVPQSTLVRLNHPGGHATETFHVWRIRHE